MNNTFEGYLRTDGTAGTRNHVGIVCSVICSSTVANEISAQVPGTIPIIHSNGCAQLGDDFQVTKNMLVGVASNPNLHSSLIVGLGCETNQISGLLNSIPKTKPLKGIGIQQLAGGKNTVNTGVAIAETWTDEAAQQKRQTLPLSMLKVGIVTADIDEHSLHMVAPVISGIVDKLVEEEATVLMGLTDILAPAADKFSETAEDAALKEELTRLSEGLDRRRWQESTDYLVSNFTREEKELAQIAAKMTGKNPVNSLLNYSEKPEGKGLHLMKATGNTIENLSNFASAGCNIAIVVSSRGIMTSSVAIPCLTLAPQNSSNSLEELVDVSVVEENIAAQVEQGFQQLLSIASGKQTILEEYELGEFSIPHVGTTF
jgi:altronate dehydratase large subunit